MALRPVTLAVMKQGQAGDTYTLQVRVITQVHPRTVTFASDDNALEVAVW